MRLQCVHPAMDRPSHSITLLIFDNRISGACVGSKRPSDRTDRITNKGAGTGKAVRTGNPGGGNIPTHHVPSIHIPLHKLASTPRMLTTALCICSLSRQEHSLLRLNLSLPSPSPTSRSSASHFAGSMSDRSPSKQQRMMSVRNSVDSEPSRNLHSRSM